MKEIKQSVSKLPYKGTRDFYPEEMVIRNYIFANIRQKIESYNYLPYDGPMLEPLDLYAAKSGEEIVRDQLYAFEDKGGRTVAIRPEMTPTLARMIAAKTRDLPTPIRWYSIPNLWRYENPQKGRLREHWQINVDMFTHGMSWGEVEIIIVAIEILLRLGADDSMFQVKINDRNLLNDFLSLELQLDEDKQRPLLKILDKKNKIRREEYITLLSNILSGEKQIKKLLEFQDSDFTNIAKKFPLITEKWNHLSKFFQTIADLGYAKYICYSPEVVRGFDYYTGLVFEIFDTDKQNPRSIYGGGRYDNLLKIFDIDSIPGIGFGLGDVTLFDFLSSHRLLPDRINSKKAMIAVFPENNLSQLWTISEKIRSYGISVEIPYGVDKVGKQIKLCEKKGIPITIFYGQDEMNNNAMKIRDLVSGKEIVCPLDEAKICLENYFTKGVFA